jgi:hypothetical protein
MTSPNAQQVLTNAVSAYPVGAVPQMATSGNVANAQAQATLPAIAGKTTYVTGFSITGAGATAAAVVNVTLAGLPTGSLNFTYCAVAGVTAANTPLVVVFPEPLPASGVAAIIQLTCPALGAGNTNNCANIYGFAQ